MKELLKELYKLKIHFFKIKIQYEIRKNKEIGRLEKISKQNIEVTAGQQRLFEEYSRTSYKTKFNNEHKKLKQKEKELAELKEKVKNLETLLQKYKPDIYGKGIAYEEDK